MKAIMRDKAELRDSGIEWIGDIPSNWSNENIKYHFDVIAGATPDSKNPEYWDGDITWVTPADYKTEDKYVKNGKRSLSLGGYQSCSASLVPEGSIIFSKRAPIGTVALSATELCTNQGCLACVPQNNVDSTYYYYVMSIATEEFELKGSGTTFKEISASNFVNTKLPYPMYEEQQSIANYLDDRCSKIDAIIAEAKASIEEYKDLKQAVIYEAVTKGLDKNVEMKDSGIEWIGKIPKHYQFIKLKYLVTRSITDGTHNTPEYDSPLSGSPFLSSKDITKGYIDWSNIKYITKSLHEKLQKEIAPQKNDILLAKNGTTGIAAVVDTDENFDIYVTLAVIRPNQKTVISQYLYYVINSWVAKRQFNDHLIGIGVPNLHLNVINNTKVILPPIDEQKIIIKHLYNECEKLDALITTKQSLIEDLESYKKSLIYEVVTGKRKVVE